MLKVWSYQSGEHSRTIMEQTPTSRSTGSREKPGANNENNLAMREVEISARERDQMGLAVYYDS